MDVSLIKDLWERYKFDPLRQSDGSVCYVRATCLTIFAFSLIGHVLLKHSLDPAVEQPNNGTVGLITVNAGSSNGGFSNAAAGSLSSGNISISSGSLNSNGVINNQGVASPSPPAAFGTSQPGANGTWNPGSSTPILGPSSEPLSANSVATGTVTASANISSGATGTSLGANSTAVSGANMASTSNSVLPAQGEKSSASTQYLQATIAGSNVSSSFVWKNQDHSKIYTQGQEGTLGLMQSGDSHAGSALSNATGSANAASATDIQALANLDSAASPPAAASAQAPMALTTSATVTAAAARATAMAATKAMSPVGVSSAGASAVGARPLLTAQAVASANAAGANVAGSNAASGNSGGMTTAAVSASSATAGTVATATTALAPQNLGESDLEVDLDSKSSWSLFGNSEEKKKNKALMRNRQKALTALADGASFLNACGNINAGYGTCHLSFAADVTANYDSRIEAKRDSFSITLETKGAQRDDPCVKFVVNSQGQYWAFDRTGRENSKCFTKSPLAQVANRISNNAKSEGLANPFPSKDAPSTSIDDSQLAMEL